MGNLCHFLVVWPWEIISFLWGYFIYWGVWGGISPLEGSAENFICKSLWKYLAKCLPHHQGSRRVRYYHPWFCLSGSSVLVKGLSLFLIQQVPNKAALNHSCGEMRQRAATTKRKALSLNLIFNNMILRGFVLENADKKTDVQFWGKRSRLISILGARSCLLFEHGIACSSVLRNQYRHN